MLGPTHTKGPSESSILGSTDIQVSGYTCREGPKQGQGSDKFYVFEIQENFLLFSDCYATTV